MARAHAVERRERHERWHRTIHTQVLFVHGFKGVELPPPPALQTIGS